VANGELCVLYPAPGTVKNDSQHWISADWRTEIAEQRAANRWVFVDGEMLGVESPVSRPVLLGNNGGDDETRTRDLCRDRAAF
jgi:hypothetical protein